jgi:hypothetical protein
MGAGETACPTSLTNCVPQEWLLDFFHKALGTLSEEGACLD